MSRQFQNIYCFVLILALSSLIVKPASSQTIADSVNLQDPKAVVEGYYEVLSKSEEEKWLDDQRAKELRSLLASEADIIMTGRSQGGVPNNKVLSLEAFTAIGRSTSNEPFYQAQVHAVTERFGDIVHVFSTYENRRSPNGKPFARSINSFQLWHDGDRWWIMNIMTHQQRNGKPIPTRYKKSGQDGNQ